MIDDGAATVERLKARAAARGVNAVPELLADLVSEEGPKLPRLGTGRARSRAPAAPAAWRTRALARQGRRLAAARRLKDDPREQALLDEVEAIQGGEQRHPQVTRRGDVVIVAQRGIYAGKPRPAVVVKAVGLDDDPLPFWSAS